MPCNWLKMPDGTIAHLRTSGKRIPKCWKCGLMSEFQCDFPMNRTRSGKILKTCDRHLCTDHARHGKTEGVDFCEEHYPIALAAYQRRLFDE